MELDNVICVWLKNCLLQKLIQAHNQEFFKAGEFSRN